MCCVWATVFMNMSHIKFEVDKLSTIMFKKSPEKNIFTIIFVAKSLKGFGWNNVGPALQTVAQHYFTIGPMYGIIRVVAFRKIKCHPYGSQSKHGAITQICSNVGTASSTIDRHYKNIRHFLSKALEQTKSGPRSSEYMNMREHFG